MPLAYARGSVRPARHGAATVRERPGTYQTLVERRKQRSNLVQLTFYGFAIDRFGTKPKIVLKIVAGAPVASKLQLAESALLINLSRARLGLKQQIEHRDRFLRRAQVKVRGTQVIQHPQQDIALANGLEQNGAARMIDPCHLVY